MATWKKTTLGLLATLIITVVGCVALLDHLFSDMCATTVIDQVASPNKKLKAVLFQVDCGATTDFNSHVALVPTDEDVFKKDALPKSFFAADGNNGRAPTSKAGGPEVRLKWLSDTHLEILHHKLVRLIGAETSSDGVTIDYRTFRQPPNLPAAT